MMSDTARIKEALTRAHRAVTLRPERGQRVYRNVATLTEGTLCQVEDGKHKLIIDVGKALGGYDAGPTPVTVLRSAMTSCVAIGIKQWAALRDIEINHVEVVLETDIDARGQLGLRDDIVPAELAADRQFEQSQIPFPLLHLEFGPNDPDMFGQKRWFLSDDPALVPRSSFLPRSNDFSDRLHRSTPHF